MEPLINPPADAEPAPGCGPKKMKANPGVDSWNASRVEQIFSSRHELSEKSQKTYGLFMDMVRGMGLFVIATLPEGRHRSMAMAKLEEFVFFVHESLRIDNNE